MDEKLQNLNKNWIEYDQSNYTLNGNLKYSVMYSPQKSSKCEDVLKILLQAMPVCR